MSRHRYFRRCAICGTYGHPKGICPVNDLNDQQEAAQKQRDQACQFLGLSTEAVTNLEQEIARIRREWYEKIHLVALPV